MAITTGNEVKFVYVPAGKTPGTVDDSTLYFFESDTNGYACVKVGNTLVADHIQITISGSGDAITGATFANGVLTLTKSDLSATYVELTDIGTAAAEDVEHFMLAANGTATGASVTLASDPTTAMGAATKQYVDSAVAGLTGAMHYKGVSTTAITDGGTETATIGGQTLTAQAGDVVIYNSVEFIWDGSQWNEFGNAGSFALKTTQVVAGDMLTGGGALSADVTLNHAVPVAAQTDTEVSGDITSAKIEVVDSITYDGFGHVTGATVSDIQDEVEAIAADAADAAASSAVEALDLSQVGGTGKYIAAVSQADGQVSATAGDIDSTVTENSTNLVTSGAVYTAIDNAASAAVPKWTVVS